MCRNSPFNKNTLVAAICDEGDLLFVEYFDTFSSLYALSVFASSRDKLYPGIKKMNSFVLFCSQFALSLQTPYKD